MEKEEFKPVLFANLASEMGYYGLTPQKIAEKTGLNYHSLWNMIAGRTDWRASFQRAIQEICFPDKTIDWLFQRFE